MPFIFVLITGPLLSTILMATYFHGYAIFFVLIILVSNAAIMMWKFFRKERTDNLMIRFYSSDVEKGKQQSRFFFLISIFTSWVSPCTVWYRKYLYESWFLLVLSSITLFIHLLGTGFLFGFINIHGIVESSSPPIFHCFFNGSINDNTTVYQLWSANESLLQLCNDCPPSMRLCEDNESPSYLFNNYVGPIVVTLILCSFASAVILQFLGNYMTMNKWSNILCCKHPIPAYSNDPEDRLSKQTNNTRRVWNEQPIFKYIKESKLGLVCLLHFLGTNCKIFNASGISAFALLSQNIEKGAVEYEHLNAYVKWYCIHILGLYQNAVCQKYFKCADILIKNGADINSVINANGRTILHCAAQECCLEEVIFLLDAKANVNSRDVKLQTPIFVAAEKGNVDIVKLLIDNGANINDINEDGEAPLHLAAFKGHFETVQLLIERGANINDKKKDGSTPLHLAVWCGHFETVQRLIEKGANINE